MNNGAIVYNADLNQSDLQNDNLHFVETNVTDAEAVNRLVAKVVDEQGKIDGLVNNAGINLPRLLADARIPTASMNSQNRILRKCLP